jgi:aspartate/methionine/tyrosine aminotransferase
VRAGQAALAAGHTRYTAARGLPALRQAISGFYRSHYGLDIDPERILVTPAAPVRCCWPAACWSTRPPLAAGRPRLPVQPPLPAPGRRRRAAGAGRPGHRLPADPVAGEQHWNADSVGALVASPANPTGTVLSADELAALSQALHARGGHLVVDEIYHGLTYGLDAPSVLQVDDSAFVLNSFSKYFGMTGWRLGWLVAPPAAVPDLEKLAQNLYISASSIAQHAALACFSEESMAIFEQRREAFRQRRDFLLPALRELGFRIEVEPQGAFYLYADVSAFTDDAQAFCAHFLETEHVAFTPGLDFGFHRANQHVRLAYTQEVPRLQEAVARIARGLKRWQGSRW